MRLITCLGLTMLVGSTLLASCAAPAPEEGAVANPDEGSGEPIGEAEEAVASFCQCTTYVYNRFSLTNPAYPNATDWGPYLTGMGYVKYSTPQVGDIIVLSAGHVGADPTAGHVGVIASITSTTFGIRGANQGGTLATEYNCNNVSTVNFTRQSTGEGYYRKSAPTGPWCSANCSGGGWWCTGDGSCIVNGVSGHNYHCPGNNVAPDVDQACPAGCFAAASGYPDYCKPAKTTCGSGAWCGNDCVGGYAKTLYTFSGSTVTSVKHCQIGYTNKTCVTAPAGTADYCN